MVGEQVGCKTIKFPKRWHMNYVCRGKILGILDDLNILSPTLHLAIDRI